MGSTSCPRLQRRRFVILSSAAAAAGSTLVSGCREHDVDVLTEDVDVNLADYPQLGTMGETVTIELEQVDFPLAITRQGEGDGFIVTGTECNHEGCGVVRSEDGWSCPCHGATFALDGGLRDGPATKGLVAYEYEVTDGVMTIFGRE